MKVVSFDLPGREKSSVTGRLYTQRAGSRDTKTPSLDRRGWVSEYPIVSSFGGATAFDGGSPLST